MSPPAQVRLPAPAIPGTLTHATGAVHAALLAEVQGEGWAAEAVEGAFRVHTLAILTGHVLALVVICGGRKRGGVCGAAHGPLHGQGVLVADNEEVAPASPSPAPAKPGRPLPGPLFQQVPTLPSPQTCLLQLASVPGRVTPSKKGPGWQGWVSPQLWARGGEGWSVSSPSHFLPVAS